MGVVQVNVGWQLPHCSFTSHAPEENLWQHSEQQVHLNRTAKTPRPTQPLIHNSQVNWVSEINPGIQVSRGESMLDR